MIAPVLHKRHQAVPGPYLNGRPYHNPCRARFRESSYNRGPERSRGSAFPAGPPAPPVAASIPLTAAAARAVTARPSRPAGAPAPGPAPAASGSSAAGPGRPGAPGPGRAGAAAGRAAASRVSLSQVSTSGLFGTTFVAASVGVRARRSATMSEMTRSVSWPTPLTTGMRLSKIAWATPSSLNAHRSSRLPPPRPTIITSTPRQRVERADGGGDRCAGAVALHRGGVDPDLGERPAPRRAFPACRARRRRSGW